MRDFWRFCKILVKKKAWHSEDMQGFQINMRDFGGICGILQDFFEIFPVLRDFIGLFIQHSVLCPVPAKEL